MQQLVQYLDSDGVRRVGLLDSPEATHAIQLSSTDSVYALTHRGLHERRALAALVEEFGTDKQVSITEAAGESRLLPAFDHPVSTARSFVWRDGDSPSLIEMAPTPQPTANISGLQANARVYTVDIHQHLRLVGHTNVAHADTVVFDAVLTVATEGENLAADTSGFANLSTDAFETALKAVTELRFGDVHFQTHAP